MDASKMTLASLTDPKIARIAIANPSTHPTANAPRKPCAPPACGKVEPKLVYGENIAHTAQFVQTGNAQVGIIAWPWRSIPRLAERGGYWLIPDNLHEPLEQGFIITKRAEGSAAKRFADYMAANRRGP